ncbi:MAG: RluA family pseudouridine synthase [Betaproteobacteria bacterium]
MGALNYTPAPCADGAPAQSLAVPAECGGMRLDQALAQLLPEHSRNRLKAWIEAGDITVDGAIRAPRHRLNGGETLTIVEHPPVADDTHAPQAIDLVIVHEDDALLVVDKPPGLVVHPGAGNPDGTLLNALLHHAPALATVARAGIVHRLDKDTSGLMVVAKTSAAQTALVRALARRAVKREYLAIAYGDIEQSLTVEAPIGRHPSARTTMAVVAGGRDARTHVTPLERYTIATLAQCTLDTGRTHQIRVHLAAIRHPLIGDPVYGPRRQVPGLPPIARQALHAFRLALTHPVTAKALRWRSEPPADFVALRDALRERDG